MSDKHFNYDYDLPKAASEAYGWKNAGGEVRLHEPHSPKDSSHFHLTYPGKENWSEKDFRLNIKNDE